MRNKRVVHAFRPGGRARSRDGSCPRPSGGSSPIWPCTARGLPAAGIAADAVGSYPTFSPLPRGVAPGVTRDASIAGPKPRGGMFSVALSVPEGYGPRSLQLAALEDGLRERATLWCPDFPPRAAPQAPRRPALRAAEQRGFRCGAGRSPGSPASSIIPLGHFQRTTPYASVASLLISRLRRDFASRRRA